MFNWLFSKKKTNNVETEYNNTFRPQLIEICTELKNILNIRDFKSYNDTELFKLYEQLEEYKEKHKLLSTLINKYKYDLEGVEELANKDYETYLRQTNPIILSGPLRLEVRYRPGGYDFIRDLETKKIKPIVF